MTLGTARRPPRLAAAELHVWEARLDEHWGAEADLPPVERQRAAAIVRPAARRRWVAARWALRTVLAGYLECDPATIELRNAARGKPQLAAGGALRFNLSHSAGLALVAVAAGREVGVDVERVGERPRAFYEAWTRREALAKCLGGGLGAPLPQRPVALSHLDLGEEWAAAVAVAGPESPPVRRFELPLSCVRA